MNDEQFIEHCNKIIGDIEHEGFDYYLSNYESPEKFKDSDPDLYKLWHQYLSISGKIMNHLITAGGRRAHGRDG